MTTLMGDDSGECQLDGDVVDDQFASVIGIKRMKYRVGHFGKLEQLTWQTICSA